MNYLYCLLVVVTTFSITACQDEQPNVATLPNVNPTTAEQSSSEVLEKWIAVGVLTGTQGINANGAAQLQHKPDGTSSVQIDLNIEPEKEMYLQAWLTNESQSEWITVGTLRNRFNDVRHSSNYESSQDLRRFTKVVVTKQAIGTESRDRIVATADLTRR